MSDAVIMQSLCRLAFGLVSPGGGRGYLGWSSGTFMQLLGLSAGRVGASLSRRLCQVARTESNEILEGTVFFSLPALNKNRVML